MKKKGFTLIELLAVIVILAIIAVITVPKIADMISSSRQGGAEDSFYGTLKAAELGYTKALQSNTDLKGSTCTIENSKITCTNGVKVEVSGKTPESGTLVIDSAGSTMAKALTLNGYKCYGDLSTENPCVKTDIDVAGETLIKKVTTSGDGLYKDTYEDERYIYRGTNPNNYLTFNGEDAGWRIIAVESDGAIKVTKEESVGKYGFDLLTSETNGSRLNKNNTYCTLDSSGKYYGCNAWNAVDGIYVSGKFKGTVTEDSFIKTYLNEDYYKNLSNKAKSQIKMYNFKKGTVTFGGQMTNIVIEEKDEVWTGNIALRNLSDWFKSSLNSECNPDINGWYTVSLGNDINNYKCVLNNYLYKSGSSMLFINPENRYNYSVTATGNGGYVVGQTAASPERDIFPTLYLKANIELTGAGTNSNPYKIK